MSVNEIDVNAVNKRTSMFQESKPQKDYKALINFEFLESQDIEVEQAPGCPWQFFVGHPDLNKRFAYYPSTGSAVYEGESGPGSSYHVNDDEELASLIFKKINDEN